jgi:hypothetical protein
MADEKSEQQPPDPLPPRHISESLKKEMDKANKQPRDPNSFLDRLRKK